jgi:pyruvate formate lyase activating enzyme
MRHRFSVETNGFLGQRLTDDELEKIDLVMLGIKTWDREKQRQLTGQDIGPTLDFARRLAARKRPIWVRVVQVKKKVSQPARLVVPVVELKADHVKPVQGCSPLAG